MIFYTSEARRDTIVQIDKLRKKMLTIPCDFPSYAECRAIASLLTILSNEIKKEDRKQQERR